MVMGFVGDVEGTGYEDDAHAEFQQVVDVAVLHLDGVLEEGDYQHHKNHFAERGLQIVDVADLHPRRTVVGLFLHRVYLADKQLIDTHAEDNQHHGEEEYIHRGDECLQKVLVFRRGDMFEKLYHTVDHDYRPLDKQRYGGEERAEDRQQSKETGEIERVLEAARYLVLVVENLGVIDGTFAQCPEQTLVITVEVPFGLHLGTHPFGLVVIDFTRTLIVLQEQVADCIDKQVGELRGKVLFRHRLFQLEKEVAFIHSHTLLVVNEHLAQSLNVLIREASVAHQTLAESS